MEIRNLVDGWWRRWSFRWMPGCCALCGGGSARDVDLCAACEAELPTNDACCAHCALPMPVAAARCGRCQKSAPEFDRAFCAFRYAWPLDSLVTRFKFSADLAAGRVLSALLARRVIAAATAQTLRLPDLILPVPLHGDRLRERGFNQAWELSLPIAAALKVPARAEGLLRMRPTPRQSGLSALHRRRNVRGAFVVQADVRGRHVAIVDDVITTAATVRECAKALKRAGAASVQVWAIARAPLPGASARDQT